MATTPMKTEDNEWEVVSEPGDHGQRTTPTPPDTGGNEADTDFEDLGGDDVSMRSLDITVSIPESTGAATPPVLAPEADPLSTSATNRQQDGLVPTAGLPSSQELIRNPEPIPPTQTQAVGSQAMEDEENDLALALAQDADEQADRRAIAAVDAVDALAEEMALARAEEAGRWGGYLASCSAVYGSPPRPQGSLDGRLPYRPRPLPSSADGPSSTSPPEHVPGADLLSKSRSFFADTAQYAINNIPPHVLDPSLRPYQANSKPKAPPKQAHHHGRSSGEMTRQRERESLFGPPGGLPHPPTRESRELLDQLRTRDGRGPAGPYSPPTGTCGEPTSSSPTSRARDVPTSASWMASHPNPIRRSPDPAACTMDDQDDEHVMSSVARLTLPPAVLEAVHHSLLFDVQRWWADALTAATESNADDDALASVLLTDDELETFMPDIDPSIARIQWREQLNQLREPRHGAMSRLDSSDDDEDGPDNETWHASVLLAARSPRYGGVGPAMSSDAMVDTHGQAELPAHGQTECA